MNTEYRRYEVKIENKVVMECDDANEEIAFAIKVSGFVFDNYEFAIIYRA